MTVYILAWTQVPQCLVEVSIWMGWYVVEMVEIVDLWQLGVSFDNSEGLMSSILGSTSSNIRWSISLTIDYSIWDSGGILNLVSSFKSTMEWCMILVGGVGVYKIGGGITITSDVRSSIGSGLVTKTSVDVSSSSMSRLSTLSSGDATITDSKSMIYNTWYIMSGVEG